MAGVSMVGWVLCGFIGMMALIAFVCLAQYAVKRL